MLMGLSVLYQATPASLLKSKKERISCSCVIEQRLLDDKSNLSYFSIMSEIAELFETRLITTSRNYYRITATSRLSIEVLLGTPRCSSYLEKYKLKSSKYLDSLDWIEASKVILSNKHTTEEGKQKIDYLKSNMNTKSWRSLVFDWSHLN